MSETSKTEHVSLEKQLRGKAFKAMHDKAMAEKDKKEREHAIKQQMMKNFSENESVKSIINTRFDRLAEYLHKEAETGRLFTTVDMSMFNGIQMLTFVDLNLSIEDKSFDYLQEFITQALLKRLSKEELNIKACKKRWIYNIYWDNY